VSQIPDYHHLQLDTQGCIDQDLTCLKCGYNLRGLLPENICPECATPISQSAHGDLLQFCDSDWITKLAKGMRCIWWALVMLILMPFIMLLVSVIKLSFLATLFAPLVVIIPSIFIILGLWLFTTPDPAETDEENNINARSFIRIALIACITVVFVYETVRFFGFGGIVLKIFSITLADLLCEVRISSLPEIPELS